MIIRADDFDHEYMKLTGLRRMQKKQRGNPGTRAKRRYRDEVTAFDIETSTIPGTQQAVMYIWQWQIGDFTVIGRTWDEFQDLCYRLKAMCKEDQYIVVYVHNLSFEFQFFAGIYEFQPEEVFCIESRKILKCDMYGCLEFRCSYLHSNMSLDEFTRKMGVEHAKLHDFDYNQFRGPWTDLTDDELKYCVNDVQGLVEALKIEMKHDGDNLYSIPLTSTGYVRRDAKAVLKGVKHFIVQDILPDYEVFEMLQEAFRGGNTHANRYYAGLILENVKSADRSSSYPDVQVNCKYPMSRWFRSGNITTDQLFDLIDRRGRAVVMRVALFNVRLHDEFWGSPYLSISKCRNIKNHEPDNGRILSADYLETTITDIDLKIIADEYDFDSMTIIDSAHSRYGYLPRKFVELVNKYYRLKTELKGSEDLFDQLLYMKSKNKLNSLYGMSAQNPIKPETQFKQGEFSILEEDYKEKLEAQNKKAFFNYAWGVWCTAWARLRLEEGIRLAGSRFVYADTDSVKYLGEIDWREYNAIREAQSKAHGAFAIDKKGKAHYMGVFEYEGEYAKFSTLGAKKYCCEDSEGNLQITIAGVGKKAGAAELRRAGGISKFKPGFIFREGGGLDAVYNDDPEIKEVTIEGHRLEITRNVCLVPGEYTLGLAGDYERLLDRLAIE